MKICLLKILDVIFGGIIGILPPSPRWLNHSLRKTSILFIRPGGIGDAVLLAPTINFLKAKDPKVYIIILAEKRNAGVFALVPGVEKVLCYDSPLDFYQALRGRYDVVIDTEQWYRLSAVVARFIQAPMKIGFDTNERRRMFTHKIKYDLSAYESDNFFSLLEPLGMGCHLNICRIHLALPIQSIFKATQLLKQICLSPFVIIFPGASIPEKRWGVERFFTVAKRLTEHGYKVVVVGGRGDRAEGELIAGAGGLNLTGLTTLTETAAVIARSRLVISGDSGVLHIAVGLGLPTVSLFGPSNVAKWAPKGEKHIVLHSKLECSPCSKFGTLPPCPNDARCMKEITADQVLEAAVILLHKINKKV